MKFVFALLLTLPAFSLPAESGPFAPPCPGCPQFGQPPYPHTGLWYNPQRSGTGINIDVQNGIMAAVYYGYRDDGSAVWHLFSGELVQSEADDVYWELEANLYEASNGEPINGEYRRPDQDVVGSIHVEFMQRHLLRFSIDGGPTQRMAPLMFGTHGLKPFEPHSDVLLPDFRGLDLAPIGSANNSAPWVILELNPDDGNVWEFGFTYRHLQWGYAGRTTYDGETVYLMTFYVYDDPPALHHSGEITCASADWVASFVSHSGRIPPESLKGEEPICVVRTFLGGPGIRFYYMPLGNLGDRRFSAVSEDGWVVEGYRLRYD